MEVIVAGHKYRLGKLVAMQQLHVSRRLTPLIARLTSLAKDITPEIDPLTGQPMPGSLLRMDLTQLMPLAEGLAELPDADVDFIVYTCLSVVQRAAANDAGWTAVLGQGNAMMFADIDMPTMLQLVMRTIWENLRSFMPGLAAIGIPDAMTPPLR